MKLTESKLIIASGNDPQRKSCLSLVESSADYECAIGTQSGSREMLIGTGTIHLLHPRTIPNVECRAVAAGTISFGRRDPFSKRVLPLSPAIAWVSTSS